MDSPVKAINIQKVKDIFFVGLQKKNPEIKSRNGKVLEDSYENGCDDLEGQGNENIIIPSNIIDIYTRREVLLGLNLSGHPNTLSKASNLIDELYKGVE